MRPGSVLSVLRRLGLDANPLRRRSDRLQSSLLVATAFLFLLGCVAGVLVGGSSYRGGLAAEQRAADGYHVSARIVSVTAWAAADGGGYMPASARVTWSDRRGGRHAQDVVVAGYPGQRVRLWVDAGGTASAKPYSHGKTVTWAVVSGAATVVLVAGGVLSGYLGLVLLIDRRRYALWEREWLVVEPGWRRQAL